MLDEDAAENKNFEQKIEKLKKKIVLRDSSIYILKTELEAARLANAPPPNLIGIDEKVHNQAIDKLKLEIKSLK
jgi:hypothetical protein